MTKSLAIIGDVHGDVQRLHLALRDLDASVEVVVLVGDYVDRGPHSYEVIELLLAARSRMQNRLICLRGNHEAALLDFLDGGPIADYARHGGLRTIKSYGFRTAHDFVSQFPETHREFLETTRHSFATDEVFVSHAGFDVDRPDDSDSPYCIYGDDRVFRHSGSWPKPTTVFGHYVQEEKPLHTSNFICIDTGCGTVEGAPLTSIILPSGEVRQY